MELKDKIIWLKGLLMECPMGKPLDNCLADEFRKLSIKERMKIVDEMKIEQIESIIGHHTKCLCEREGRQLHELIYLAGDVTVAD